MKKLFWLLAVVALGALVWHFSGGDEQGGRRPGGVVPVVVVSIYEESIHDNVEALGTAFANESIDITANATETISEIKFDDGQLVKKGDVIVLLEQREEQAQLKAAQARLTEHKRELKRLENLLQNKAASKREYDERQTMLEITGQEVKEIKARIEERTLRAPFDGVLGLRRLSEGGLVRPGDIITTLDDIHRIKLDFNVSDIYLSKLSVGMPIEARSASLGEGLFKGVVANIDTRNDPVTRSVLVRAIIPNENRLIKPGVLMQVTMLQDERSAIVAPEEAILQKQDKHYVMLVNADTLKVERREVEVGTRRPGIVEIEKGLAVGNMVVVRGIDQVSEGQEVSIKEIWGKAKKPDIDLNVGEK